MQTAVSGTLTGRPSPAGTRSAISVPLFCLFGVAFVLLATANGAGYRYGVSDQAFYIPVVTRALDPAAFPRDAALIDAQGRLMLVDEVIAGIIRATGLSLEVLFFAGYLISLAVMWFGVTAIGSRIYASTWGTVALGAALTLRHRISRTSANSFEPYFHPRMLAFAICLIAVAALLRRRFVAAVVLVGISAVIHVTTALWFALLIGVAMAVLDVRLRRLAYTIAAFCVVFAVWAFSVGPLRTRMDDVWLQAVASKDSLFATTWPAWAWIANLALLAVLWWAHTRRRAAGDATPEDAALVWGATALVAFFLITLPFVYAHIAFVVQLQISRVFWLVDALATVYLLSIVRNERVMRGLAIALVTFAVARGVYVMTVERPDRGLFALRLAPSPWTDAMHWISTTTLDANVLADPGHSWKYGTSVRVSAGRDVVLEEVKDSSIAIYSRDVAVRVVERTAALADFATITADRVRELGAKYEATYLVTEAELSLPIAYRNDRFRVYALKP